MSTVDAPLLYTMSMSPVTPECRNVESPMTATVFLRASAPSALSMPCAMPTLAPMHTHESTDSNGGIAPSV